MLVKLNNIIIFALIAFFIAWILYPIYISILKKYKLGKTIREAAVTWEKSQIFTQLHEHKKGTPTMWGGIFLLIMGLMIGLSYLLKDMGWINNTLFNRQETYIILFGFFSMGLIGLVDDFLNIKGHGAVKGLSAKAKLIGMIIFSAFISRWFYSRLGIDYINFWPIAGKISLGLFYPILTFFVTIAIVNAINIVDGLDGLAGGLMTVILFVLAIMLFFNQTYIAATVIAIVIAILVAFMFYNIHPAKIFMGDSGAFALWWLIAWLLYFLNMRTWIIIPFIILFSLFIIDLTTSFLQIFRKKYMKRKLFLVAPLHHLFEKNGINETTIVMKARFIQGILAAITVIFLFYQVSKEFIN
jgi:phospho-N-acetylmuramoyl-pentapeptide-transferase